MDENFINVLLVFAGFFLLVCVFCLGMGAGGYLFQSSSGLSCDYVIVKECDYEVCERMSLVKKSGPKIKNTREVLDHIYTGNLYDLALSQNVDSTNLILLE